MAEYQELKCPDKKPIESCAKCLVKNAVFRAQHAEFEMKRRGLLREWTTPADIVAYGQTMDIKGVKCQQCIMKMFKEHEDK